MYFEKLITHVWRIGREVPEPAEGLTVNIDLIDLWSGQNFFQLNQNKHPSLVYILPDYDTKSTYFLRSIKKWNDSSKR